MTATVVQGVAVAGIAGSPPARMAQGVMIAAVSFQPPNAPPEIAQGVIIAAVRQFPVVRGLVVSPAVDLPCIASCGSVPYFWRTI